MALALLGRVVGAAEVIDDVAALVAGAVDAYLLKWNALAFLAKNVAVPIAFRFVKLPLPGVRGLMLESEGMLGFIIATLLAYK